MMHTGLDSVLILMEKLADQLDRTINIVQKQNSRIESLETRVAKLEKQKEEN